MAAITVAPLLRVLWLTFRWWQEGDTSGGVVEPGSTGTSGVIMILLKSLVEAMGWPEGDIGWVDIPALESDRKAREPFETLVVQVRHRQTGREYPVTSDRPRGSDTSKPAPLE